MAYIKLWTNFCKICMYFEMIILNLIGHAVNIFNSAAQMSPASEASSKLSPTPCEYHFNAAAYTGAGLACLTACNPSYLSMSPTCCGSVSCVMATDVNKCMPMFAINLELLCWYACHHVRADDPTKTKEFVLLLGAQN